MFKIFMITVFGYFVITLVWIRLEPIKAIDFPCFVSISKEGCIIIGRGLKTKPAMIEFYLTTYCADCMGGGCWYKASETNEISLANHLFRKDGENLIIDEKIILKKNEEWEDVKLVSFPLNPWRLTKEKISIKNNGIIACTEDPKTKDISIYGPTLIVTGSTGTYYEANYIGILIFFVLVGLLIFKKIISR
jgi:hypothetical protein